MLDEEMKMYSFILYLASNLDSHNILKLIKN